MIKKYALQAMITHVFIILNTTICMATQIQLEDAPRPLILKIQSNQDLTHFSLNAHFLNNAHRQNPTLKIADPDCFTPDFIKNKQASRQKLHDLGGVYVTIPSATSQQIHATFFDRGSNILLIIGGGFPVNRERMLPFILLFPHYDIVIFDYPGIGLDHQVNITDYLVPWKWKGALSQRIVPLDLNCSGIGTTEEHELIEVATYFRHHKKYDATLGLALCFSSYVFAKAAALEPHLFTKLMFDGSWPSLERVIKTIIANPSLICSVENPRSCLPCLTHQPLFQSCTMTFFEWLTWTNLHAPSLARYLTDIRCPILFFQSEFDCYCNAQEFETIWDSVPTPKAAVITQNFHGRNHISQTHAYQALALTFFEYSFDRFITSIQAMQNQ